MFASSRTAPPTVISITRAEKLLEQKKFITLRGKYVLTGEQLDFDGSWNIVEFSVDKQGFPSFGEFKKGRQVLGSAPLGLEILRIAVEKLYDAESLSLRLRADYEDQLFLNRIGG